jgi:hypothetical protein
MAANWWDTDPPEQRPAQAGNWWDTDPPDAAPTPPQAQPVSPPPMVDPRVEELSAIMRQGAAEADAARMTHRPVAQEQVTPAAWGDVFGAVPGQVQAFAANAIAGSKLRALRELEQSYAAHDPHKLRLGVLDEPIAREQGVIDEVARSRQELSVPNMNALQSGVQQALVSLPIAAPAFAAGILTRNPAIAASTMMPPTAADKYAELSAAGLPHDLAAKHGDFQGIVEAGTELMPFAAYLDKIPGGQMILRSLASELPGEALATVLQGASDFVAAAQGRGETLTPDLAIAALREATKQVPETLIATVLGTSIQTGAMSGVNELVQQVQARTPPSMDGPMPSGETMAQGAQLEPLSAMMMPEAPQPAWWDADPPAAQTAPEIAAPVAQQQAPAPSAPELVAPAAPEASTAPPMDARPTLPQTGELLPPAEDDDPFANPSKAPDALGLVEPPPPAPQAPQKRNYRAPDARRDSILEFLSKYKGSGAKSRGLNLQHMVESLGWGEKELRSVFAIGINRPFTKNGMTLDHAAEILAEAGYPVQNERGDYDPNVLLDLIRNELVQQQKTYSHLNTTWMEEQFADEPPPLTAADLTNEGLTNEEQWPDIAELVTQATEVDEAAAEKAVIRFGEDDAGLAAELRRIIAQAGVPGPADQAGDRTPQGATWEQSGAGQQAVIPGAEVVAPAPPEPLTLEGGQDLTPPPQPKLALEGGAMAPPRAPDRPRADVPASVGGGLFAQPATEPAATEALSPEVNKYLDGIEQMMRENGENGLGQTEAFMGFGYADPGLFGPLKDLEGDIKPIEQAPAALQEAWEHVLSNEGRYALSELLDGRSGDQTYTLNEAVPRGAMPAMANEPAQQEERDDDADDFEPDLEENLKALDEASDSWPFPTMPPEQIFPAPGKGERVIAERYAGPEITQEEAAKRLEEWKAEAKRVGREEDHSSEVILSLFDASGVFSQPYVDAGYDVRRFDIENGDDLARFTPIADIREILESGKKIVGVIAQPPCTSFAVSGAQWWKKQHDVPGLVAEKYGLWASTVFETPVEYAQYLVDVTKLIVELANPSQFHVLENPTGRIKEKAGLPEQLLTFNPHHYGFPYTKVTHLWGSFNPTLPYANVKPVKGSYAHRLRGDVRDQKALRSLTPEQVAYAFFMANHQAAEAKAEPAPRAAAAKPRKPKKSRYPEPTNTNYVPPSPTESHFPISRSDFKKLICASCSSTKAAPATKGMPMRAESLYAPGAIVSSMATIPEKERPDILFLSGKVGLVAHDMPIAPYEQAMTAAIADGYIGNADMRDAFANSLAEFKGGNVLIAAGGEYKRVYSAWMDQLKSDPRLDGVSITWAPGEIGKMRGAVKAFAQPEAAPKNEAPAPITRGTAIPMAKRKQYRALEQRIEKLQADESPGVYGELRTALDQRAKMSAALVKEYGSFEFEEMLRLEGEMAERAKKKAPKADERADLPATETVAFKRWFGASKVLDSEGKPLRLFHHTYKDFNTFKPGGYDPKLSGVAIWLTEVADANEAAFAHQTRWAKHNGAALFHPDSYVVSGARTLPLYARIENPLIVKMGDNIQLFPPDRVKKLKAEGYDGAIQRDESGKITEAVVFDPGQVKSATGNSGKFSRKSSAIDESRPLSVSGGAPRKKFRRRRDVILPAQGPLAMTRQGEIGVSGRDALWSNNGLDPDTMTLRPPADQIRAGIAIMQRRYRFPEIGVDANLNKREAIDVLMDGYVGLNNLAAILGIPDRLMSFDGKLSLQLGSGRGNALGSHRMNPDGTHQITLVRRNDTFAHEWGHGLDYRLLLENHIPLMEAIEKGRAQSGKTRLAGIEDKSNPVAQAWVNVLNAMFFDTGKLDAFVQGLEQKIRNTKSASQRAKLEAQLDNIERGKARPTSKGRDLASDYLTNARNVGGKTIGAETADDGYWQRPTEMFARAFEAWVAHRVETEGSADNAFLGMRDYLYQLDRTAAFQQTYPLASDRAAIFDAIEKLVDAMRHAGTLGFDEPGTSTVETAKPRDWRDTIPVTERTNYQKLVHDMKSEVQHGKRRKAETKRQAKDLIERRLERVQAKGGNAATLNVGRRTYLAAVESAEDALTGTLLSVRGHAFAMERRYPNSKALKRIRRWFFTDPGAGTMQRGGKYNERIQAEVRRFSNRLSNIAEGAGMAEWDETQQRAMRDVLVGIRPVADKAQETAAASLRRLLDDLWYFAQKRGLNVGYTPNGFLPRMVDQQKLIANPTGFVEAATRAYELVFDRDFKLSPDPEALMEIARMARAIRMGTPEHAKRFKEAAQQLAALQNDPRAARDAWDAMEPELAQLLSELRPVYSEKAANDWYNRNMGINEGKMYDPDARGPTGSFMKARHLTPQADEIMADFYVTDPEMLISTYLTQVIRRATYAEFFGAPTSKRPIGWKLEDAYNDLRRDGVNEDDLEALKLGLDLATGTYKTTVTRRGLRWRSSITAWYIPYILGRMIFSQLAEPHTAGVRAGSVLRGFEAQGLMIRDLLAWMKLLPKGQIERAQWLSDFSETLGITTDAYADELMQSRFNLLYQSPHNARKLSRFFRTIGAHQHTMAMRRAAVSIAMKEVLVRMEQHASNPPSSKPAKRAYRFLAELGLRPQDKALQDMIKWLATRPPMAEIERHPHFREIQDAVGRFVDESIMNPTVEDKPAWASRPETAHLYGILSFTLAFQRKVMIRSMKLARQAATNRDAAQVASILAPLATLIAMQLAAYSLRFMALGGSEDDLEKELTKEGPMGLPNWVWIAATRSGLLGITDPLFNAVFGIKYERDLANLAVGPVLSVPISAGQRLIAAGLSEAKTETAEFRATTGLYDAVVGPLAVSMLLRGPAVYPWALAGATVIPLTSSTRAKEAFAELFYENPRDKPKKEESGFQYR